MPTWHCIRVGYRRNIGTERIRVLRGSIGKKILTILHWTLEMRKRENSGAGGKKSRQKRKLHVVVWMVGR
jgi:hypothetical protein